VARSPQPLSMSAEKGPGETRIFVFGESAAMGDPEPAYGLARQLEVLLRARHPDRRIQVFNVAMTAINSHVIREIARDCVPRQGDLWLVYAANNEVIGPFGAGTVFGKQAAGLGAVRMSLALRATRLGQLILSLKGNADSSVQWEGMEMFLRHQVRLDDARLERVYQNFAANLDAIFSLAERADAKVLAATVGVNLRDCAPFASQHRLGMRTNEIV